VIGNSSLIALSAVMKKEFRQAFRDRRMAAMLLVLPIMQLVVLGFAVDLEVRDIPTAICDLDRTEVSRNLAAQLSAEGTYRQTLVEPDPELASELLESGKAAAVIVIEQGYAQNLARGSEGSIQILVDGTDPNRAQIALQTASQLSSAQAITILADRARANRVATAVGSIRLAPRILYNPSMKSARYMVPGVAATILLIVTTIVTAMGITRERELGTLEQILVSPLPPWVLLLGKCLPFAFVGLIEVFAILAVGSILFDVPLRGSMLLVGIATSLYLMTTLGVGVFISTVSRSQQQAILGGFFFLMPAILLSGFMTPIQNMPSWLRPLTYVNPVRYFVEILRGCLLKGSTFHDLWFQLTALLIFGILVLAASIARFRKTLN
jgi:ABC-2 type transport system permease protein